MGEGEGCFDFLSEDIERRREFYFESNCVECNMDFSLNEKFVP